MHCLVLGSHWQYDLHDEKQHARGEHYYQPWRLADLKLSNSKGPMRLVDLICWHGRVI